MKELVKIDSLNAKGETLEEIRDLKEFHKKVKEGKERYSKLWEKEENQLKKYTYLELFRDFKRVEEQTEEKLIELLDKYKLTFE
ncbi:MAG: hypothetical protein ACLR3R_09025 [Clostridium paraputrificum]|uniref:hypothetical protein n=1 Tax=Clostridium sp. TaxID=1506 RepID=UPI0029078934|nr:hypothetical protein [Clostridium sp.]MDU5742042.1 hypothetical protein [Clostridium sp.]MDU5786445.1 hypothetical protein [Clostridium sp.]